MSKQHPNEWMPIMIVPGMFTEERVISRIREHVPNRFGDGSIPDLTGYASIDGKRVRVETGVWGDAIIWQVAAHD